jgi:BirA family biotin operon repressor/biotin-[acetyl-CoA-carboxylase] ligase
MAGRLIIHDKAESTQDLAREMAQQGEPEGTAVMALSQTRGRGRAGRSWSSPPGKNIALSLLLRPRLTPGDTVLLGLLAAIAVAETVEGRGVRQAQLRWPNDVLVQDRKIAGILSEAVIESGAIDFLIIGVGFNVNTLESDFPRDLRTPATSLFLCTGEESDLEEVAGEFLGKMDRLYSRVKKEGCAFIPSLWEHRWPHRGRMLVHDDTAGTGLGLDTDGALILQQEDGSMTRIVSGDVLPASPVRTG